MHEDNKIRNPQEVYDLPSRRAEIVLRFDYPEKDVTPEAMALIVAIIKRNMIPKFGQNTEVEGKWL